MRGFFWGTIALWVLVVIALATGHRGLVTVLAFLLLVSQICLLIEAGRRKDDGAKVQKARLPSR